VCLSTFEFGFRRLLLEFGRYAEERAKRQKTLNAKLRGHYQYYGRPTNSQSLLKFYRGVVRIWRKWLNRRTRGNRMTWERYIELLRRHPLLPSRIRHVWM
jgi:RNA-directed DNA polymerase